MAVTMEMIKSLRDSTGVSITECKKALEASAGDIDIAIEELRKKGMSKASKRAVNNTSEGRIKIDTDGTTAYIIGLHVRLTSCHEMIALLLILMKHLLS